MRSENPSGQALRCQSFTQWPMPLSRRSEYWAANTKRTGQIDGEFGSVPGGKSIRLKSARARDGVRL